MAPTPQDRRLHEHLYRLAASGEPVTAQELLQLIDYANRLAVERCRACREARSGRDETAPRAPP